MQIETGKFYKTRDGQNVGPMYHCGEGTEHPWEEAGNASSHIWRDDGTSGWDDPQLIAEWVDEPTTPDLAALVAQHRITCGKDWHNRQDSHDFAVYERE